MIHRLTAEEISDHWDAIRFSILTVNPQADNKKARFVAGYLIDLFLKKAHCYFFLNEKREITTVAIVKIKGNPLSSELPFLLIDTVYGYAPASGEDKTEFFRKMDDLARNLNLGKIRVNTNNTMVANIVKKHGMKEAFRVFESEVK